MEIKSNEIVLQKQEEKYIITKNTMVWSTSGNARIILNNGRYIPFIQAKNIKSEVIKQGTGIGIMTHYDDFKGVNFAFDTYVWIEYATGHVYFEWIPLNDRGFDIKEVEWPSSMEFKEKDGFSVIPYMQGVLLPFSYEADFSSIPFNGQLCSSALYMPWLGQYTNQSGYMMINETPWDARYEVKHQANIRSEIQMKWLPSLNKMNYRRILQYRFFDVCDYNEMCKSYREYVKEKGYFISLHEKALVLPKIEKLKKSMFVHMGIKTHIEEGTRFYQKKKNHVIYFDECEKKMLEYYDKGIRNLYLHLDGWSEYGYDNHHPDILPVCKEAGGYEGLKRLSKTMKQCGYLLGLHDQYRDYYHKAESYDIRNALQNVDGSFHEHNLWAGGVQNYLCASLAKGYVKRNYEMLFKQDIVLDVAYLDVFTCNELDECINARHRMTRKECAEYRESCFRYLMSKDVIPTSEECSDWAMRSLVSAHYGPHEFMLKEDCESHLGIAVPLFNLVYHECMILPWPMERRKEDFMFYALLNGGLPYLRRDGAYPDTDGAFVGEEMDVEMHEKRCQIVQDFATHVAGKELLKHEFLKGMHKQRSVFSDGSEVIVDFKENRYEIKKSSDS